MAQIRCGTLKASTPNEGDMRFQGRITLAGRLDDVYALTPHPRANPNNESSPAYEVQLVKSGRMIACGAAWLKNHDKIGDFLSITIDDVRWPRAVHLTAFPPESKDSKDWNVVWSRPRAKRVEDDSFDELTTQES